MTSASISNVTVSLNAYSNLSAKSDDISIGFSSVMNKSMDLGKMKSASTTDTDHRTDVRATATQKSDESASTDETYAIDSGRKDLVKTVSDKTDLDESEMETLTEEVSEFSENVIQTIAKELDLSEEDVTAAMETLGLTALDLINPKNMVSLISTLTESTDAVSMLMSDSFHNIMNSVNEMVGSLSESTGMDISTIVELLTPVEEEPVDPMMNLVPSVENLKDGTEFADAKSDISIPQDVEIDEEMAVKPDESVESTTEELPVDVLESHTANKNPDKKGSLDGIISNAEGESEDTTLSEGKITSVKENPTADDFKEFLDDDSNYGSNMQQTVTNESTSTIEVESVNQTFSYSEIDPEELINQIVERARVTIDEEVSTMEMELNPEHLGKLFMEVSSDKEGNVTAKIFTENENVKSALEGQLNLLMDKLNVQGSKVQAIEVSVGTHEFEENLESDQASLNEREASEDQQRDGQRSRPRNMNLNSLDELQGLMTEEEELAYKLMRDNGNTVNLTA